MRHKWVKLRPHVYICRVCGMGRVNELSRGQWETTFHRPDGTSNVERHVPPCAVGPLTPAFIEKHQTAIAAQVQKLAKEQTA